MNLVVAQYLLHGVVRSTDCIQHVLSGALLWFFWDHIHQYCFQTSNFRLPLVIIRSFAIRYVPLAGRNLPLSGGVLYMWVTVSHCVRDLLTVCGSVRCCLYSKGECSYHNDASLLCGRHTPNAIRMRKPRTTKRSALCG